MPSPIVHLATGYLVAHVTARRLPQPLESRDRNLLIAYAAFVSVLPDLDWIPDLLLGQPGRFHNSYSHSLLMAFPVALVAGGLAAAARPWLFRLAAGVALICYTLHVAMDFFTVGRGVMLFWPLTAERFAPPVHLFYGVRWSDGLWSHRHIWTVFSEGVVVLASALALKRWSRAAPTRSAQSLS